MYLHKNDLHLRKVTRTDLKALLELKSESWFGTHKVSILNKEDQVKWFDKISDSSTDIILIGEQHNGKTFKPVGTFKIAGIDWVNRTCNIGEDIYRDCRGKGLGYKIVEAGIDFCFEILNMNRLDAEVLATNIASQKVLFGGGFKKEGRRRKAVYKCNKHIDSLILGIIKDDWINLERIKKYGSSCNKTVMFK